MNLLESAVTTIGVMITVTGFHGVSRVKERENEMNRKINWDNVIVKTVNWSCWFLLATLAVALISTYLGSEKAGRVIGLAVGAYMLGWVPVMVTAWINDTPFKRKKKGSTPEPPATLDKNAQNNAEPNVVQHHVRA